MTQSNFNTSAVLQLQYDKELSIATATNRFATKWINKTILISGMVQKLTTTTRTHETSDEYAAMPKDDRDAIKDVGAFVGGTLKGGRRRKVDVANRHLITLDIDYAARATKDKIKKALSNMCFTIYSTHTHTPEKPRYRLIIYPDRVMLSDEYQAVSRRMAEHIDIEVFDGTSYDTNRLFYWPSTSSDGEFVAYHHDAPFLPINTILAEYGADDAWRDVSLWPRSSKETKAIDRLLKKQVDPRTKQNIIGAFCRTVSIRNAIERWLRDVYKKEGSDRYTYIPGSGAKGLVIYNDVFAYSNHDTDPCSGQTCNAFDLVRIHKFGHLDSDADFGTPSMKLPSYREMIEWAHDVEGVRIDLIKNNLVTVDISDFDDFDKDEGEGEGKWIERLQVTEGGIIKTSFFNAVQILRNDPGIKDQMRLNLFSEQVEHSDTSYDWSDQDSLKIREYIGGKYSVDFPAVKIIDAIEYQASMSAYHPVRDYLESLAWDGKLRIADLFIRYFGCSDNEYVRDATLCWFTAAVYRVYEPGYKFDTSLVLSGAQGIGKTFFLREIGKTKWYGELSSFDPKIAIEEITGKWIVEISELSATNKQELEQQKSFLSACSTRVRMAYARYAKEFRRQCIFMGTTNMSEYLKDSTGNRRWWPLDATTDQIIDIDALRADVDQIWAEAYHLYKEGRSVILTDVAAKIAADAQEDKQEIDEWTGVIESWLAEETYPDRYDQKKGSFEQGDKILRDKVCIPEIWDDCLEIKCLPRPADKRRIGQILNNMKGWKKGTTSRFGMRYGTQKVWKNDIPF
jgi:hypothetical protein